jgi:hypothetical protein
LKLLRHSPRAETFEGLLAKYVGVVLTGLCELDDALGDNALGEMTGDRTVLGKISAVRCAMGI